MPTLAQARAISMKTHSEFTEKWLEDQIVGDSSILGLGDVIVVERQRRQEKAGRLDLLLESPDEERRYEVELMLGAADETHIVRCIEYRDIERRRYPGYKHCAVLIAEDITTRFLNVLTLMAGNIPIVAIRMKALQVGDQVVLDFLRILDQEPLRTEPPTTTADDVDLAYWQNWASPKTVEIAPQLLLVINEKADPPRRLNCNRYSIGLSDGLRSGNFVYFIRRKSFTKVVAQVSEPELWSQRVTAAGLDAAVKGGSIHLTLAPDDLAANHAVLVELLHQAVAEYQA